MLRFHIHKTAFHSMYVFVAFCFVGGSDADGSGDEVGGDSDDSRDPDTRYLP